jgi:hypothetical protein
MLTFVVAPAVALALVLPAAAQSSADQASTTTTTEEARVAAGGWKGRPFKDSSYWNTPLGKAPVDRYSRKYIRDSQKKAHTQNYLKLVKGEWGMPHYSAKPRHPLYRINPGNGPTFRVHIPKRARPMPTNDAALTVIDRSTNQVISLQGAQYHRSTNRWTADGASRYWLSSNGIHEDLRGGTNGNEGHRGLPGSIRMVTKREIKRGAIRHRLEVYWWETASRTPQGRDAYFPMSGSESGKNGVVPEGIVIRIRPSVNLKERNLSPAAMVIAKALKRYGAVVGDNSGSGNNLKLQANTDWSGILHQDSLRALKWRDFVFVKGGYRP